MRDIMQKLKEYREIVMWLRENVQAKVIETSMGAYAEILTHVMLSLEDKEVKFAKLINQKGYDLLATEEGKAVRYQVKSRMYKKNNRFKFDHIKNLELFDYLIIIVFDEEFKVKEAYRISSSYVKQICQKPKNTKDNKSKPQYTIRLTEKIRNLARNDEDNKENKIIEIKDKYANAMHEIEK